MQADTATPVLMPQAAQRRLQPEAADGIEYSTSEEDDESSGSTATSSSNTGDGDDESTDTESSAGEDELDEAAVDADEAAVDANTANMMDDSQRLPETPMDQEVDLARKRKAPNQSPVAKVPRLDEEASAEQSAEQSESESATSESSEPSETSGQSGSEEPPQKPPQPPQKPSLVAEPQANNSSCVEPPLADAKAPPVIEEPLTLERVSSESYQFSPTGPLDPWRVGGGAVQAVASSRARITNSKGEQLSLGGSSSEAVGDDSEDVEASGSGGSEAFVTTEASGTNPSAAIARATARAASIAGAALARGRARQGAEEYRIFISTSCTVRPSPVLEPSRLQITVSSDSELQQRPELTDPGAAAGEAEKRRVVSSPRRLDSRDSSENVFSLLRLGRQDTTQETVTQELPSPAKGDKFDYADFEAVTRSVIQSRYNTERREDIADDYCRRATKAVQAEVQLIEQLKTDASAEAADRLGRIRSDQERFLELKRQLDALKARQLARQRQLETPRQAAIPPHSATVPAPKTQERDRQPASPQSGDTTQLGGNMAESAYISDSSDPNSPASDDKASPEEPQRHPYHSVLQEAAVLPGGARPSPRHHQSSLQLDQERLKRARNEYFRRPVFDSTARPGQSGSLRSGGSSSPSDYRARSASSTLSKASSQSMYQLRELLDDQSALQAYSRLSGSGRRRYLSTDIDDMPDDDGGGGGVADSASVAGSAYDLNAFDTEPGNYKSVSLFDLRRSMLANDVRAAGATKIAGGNANDSKSYVSLIETDLDTGEELSHEIVMETDVDAESPLSPAPKSQSLLDLAVMPRPTPGGVFDGLGARDAELDRRLNRANSEDMLDSGAAPTTARRVKANRTNSKRRQQQQQQEKSFIQRLEERATSESEKAICKSLSRLDIPKWMDNLKLNQDSAAAAAAAASAAEAPRPWSTKHSLGAGRESTASTGDTDQSLQPLIIPKFVSLPVRPALFSPGYSSLSARREESSERDFEKAQVSVERSRPPPAASEEPKKKYFTESSIQRDSQPAASATGGRQQRPPPQPQAPTRLPLAPSLALAPLKLDPADFLPKTDKSAATAPEEALVEAPVAVRTAVFAESELPPPPPRLSTLPPESLEGLSDESRDESRNGGGDDRPGSEASNIMFIDRSFRDTSEQQLQLLGDTSTTVSTDFPSDSQSENESASAVGQQNDDYEDAESSGSSEDSSDDSSTTGSSSSESYTSGSEETSEAEETGSDDEEEPQPQPQPQPQQQTQHQLPNGSAQHSSSESDGSASEPAKMPLSSSAPGLKQQSRTASSGSSEGSSSGSSGSASSDDESAESEEETVIETSVLQSRLLRRPEPEDGRLLASQAVAAATVSYSDGLGRQSQTAAALAFADRQLAAARNSVLSAPLAAATAALPVTQAAQEGRRSSPVSLAEEIQLAAGQNRGIIRDADRYLVECVNPRCAKRAELPQAQRSFVSCGSCYTYYCSAECRRGHWDAHKHNCAFARAADGCRSAARRLLNNGAAYRAISSLARSGHRSLGRGCVFLLLSDAGDRTLPLRPPVFAPVGDLATSGLVGEQLREVTAACRSFDPTGALVLCTAVSVGAEISRAAPASGPLVTAWSFLRLASEEAAEETAASAVAAGAAAAEAAAAEAEQRREEQLRQSRADLLDQVRRELRQRGVSLRHHYPSLMATLQEFVDTGREFPAQIIRPVDTTCGRTFEYCVQPGAEPVTSWVFTEMRPRKCLLAIKWLWSHLW